MASSRAGIAFALLSLVTGTAAAAPPSACDDPQSGPAPAEAPIRRRPGQSSVNTPTAEGERPGTGTPAEAARKRRPFDPNRCSGLARIAKPPADAPYDMNRVPDRWQLTRQLGITDYPWFDPYHQNVWKGDRPLHGDWFLSLGAVSDTVVEPRFLPTPVGPQGEAGAGQLDTIGDSNQWLLSQTVTASAVYYEGDTTFKPPEYEYRLTLAFNFNYAEAEQARVLQVDPRDGRTRRDGHVGVQDLFVDKHLRNVSERYDFDSLRFGIQPFNADFRGFLFQDQQLGLRLFGNRDNNRWQYNLAWFRRLEKDTNSGLNAVDRRLRSDDVFVANLYRQDWPVPGFTSQGVLLYNRNREGDEAPFYDDNGFIQRPSSLGREQPRNYDVVYPGLNGDGHFGRMNLTGSLYAALGHADAGTFVDAPVDVRAFFGAAEASWDFDWRRVRLSLLYTSPDRDPYDGRETGFDAVFENPVFAGFDTSFWIRQSVPLIGGGIVGISGRNGVINSLRSSKDQGQSNFANPGTLLLGAGTDLDLTPQWRLSLNANELFFADTTVIEVARQQAAVDEHIGLDLSAALIWRPYFTQNVVLRASVATLVPGQAYRQLFGDELNYSTLLNLVLTY